MKNDELLHKWVNGELTAAEQRAFEQRPEFAELQALYRGTAHLRVPPAEGEAVLATILARPKKRSPLVARRRWIGLAAAAAVLLVAAYLFFPSGNTIQWETGLAETQTHTLPDGSTVRLNAATVVEFSEQNWATERTLSLSGEAFFDVVSGSTFTVSTPTGAVRVLGTQFNVRARAEALEVTCSEGRVAVLVADTPVAELGPGDGLRSLDPTTAPERFRFAPTPLPGWWDGVFRFRSVPLRQVLDELERQFALQIDAEAVNVETVVSAAFTKTDADQALRAVLGPLGYTYTRRAGNRIELAAE